MTEDIVSFTGMIYDRALDMTLTTTDMMDLGRSHSVALEMYKIDFGHVSSIAQHW